MGIGIATAALTACGGATSYTSNCSDGLCTVSLTGAGAEAELLDGDVVVELDGADGTTADLRVNDESGSCTAGEELALGGLSVTCTEVGDDRVTVELR